ncbi:MAG: ATP-dependent RecD-like DNA helicase [Legionella sp.]|nr:ATP-dependent RecD-like DNA helicase [Legionella sp.]
MVGIQPSEATLQGAIERVTFHSEESGFSVLRVQVKGKRELVTVIGNAPTVSAGEYIDCQGLWVNDPQHGLQFKAAQLQVLLPTTLEGIEKYLGSGMVKGIGPHFAKKLMRAFGASVFEVIESYPEQLLLLDGIGEKRQAQIVSAWAEQKAVRHIMVFLQSHGVGTARAVRIYKTYGDAAIEKLQENPYRLALEIRGIGFKTADTIAERLGIAKDSPLRAQAGLHHVLNELCEKGHCAAPRAQLITASYQLLEIPEPIIEAAIEQELNTEKLVLDDIQGEACIYPVFLFQAERKSAERLKQLHKGIPPWGVIEFDKAIPWVEEITGLQLSASQKQALQQLMTTKLAVITGGPGVGKTTLVNSFLKIIQTKKIRVALCAPTGRAAKRLTETTGVPAKTIHRLLDFDPQTYGFKHNQGNPIDKDLFIIDESSMLDILLLNNLLKAIPSNAAVIFVGDIDQLPSVGSGAVLADLIRSEKIATVRLTEIFRQAASSHIILNAHRVNQGKMPLPNASRQSDFFTLYAETAEEIQAKLIQLVGERLPNYYRCDPIRDIQVLTPMNRGGLGSRGLNVLLQQRLNGTSEPKIMRFGTTFAPGDKVIQMTNNYDKEVFNGDIGFIEHIDLTDERIRIRFDQQYKEYEANELDELSLAYAISIHKSQGSEFPIVVMPVATQHFTLLARNLLYTGITRGKRLVVLLGQKKAVGMAVSNNKEAARLTKLDQRIADMLEAATA